MHEYQRLELLLNSILEKNGSFSIKQITWGIRDNEHVSYQTFDKTLLDNIVEFLHLKLRERGLSYSFQLKITPSTKHQGKYRLSFVESEENTKRLKRFFSQFEMHTTTATLDYQLYPHPISLDKTIIEMHYQIDSVISPLSQPIRFELIQGEAANQTTTQTLNKGQLVLNIPLTDLMVIPTAQLEQGDVGLWMIEGNDQGKALAAVLVHKNQIQPTLPTATLIRWAKFEMNTLLQDKNKTNAAKRILLAKLITDVTAKLETLEETDPYYPEKLMLLDLFEIADRGLQDDANEARFAAFHSNPTQEDYFVSQLAQSVDTWGLSVARDKLKAPSSSAGDSHAEPRSLLRLPKYSLGSHKS